MDWADWTLWAGIFTVLTGLALTLLLVGRRLRGHDRPRGPSAHYVEGVDVLVGQTLLLGGMALTTFGNIAGHIRGNALPTGPWLSFLGGVGAFLLFGLQLGPLADALAGGAPLSRIRYSFENLYNEHRSAMRFGS